MGCMNTSLRRHYVEKKNMDKLSLITGGKIVIYKPVGVALSEVTVTPLAVALQ